MNVRTLAEAVLDAIAIAEDIGQARSGFGHGLEDRADLAEALVEAVRTRDIARERASKLRPEAPMSALESRLCEVYFAT